MTTRILLTVILAVVFATTAWPAMPTQVFDFIRFADNGSDGVVDLPGLVSALRSGADPNWINREHKRPESTLSHFSMFCSIFREPRTITADCIQAIKTLIGAGAKLQPVDQEILYFPVANGKTEIVALLLNLGADATSWPNKQIGTPLSPVEVAVGKGHQAAVDLLAAHGATRPKERDAIQWRFVEAAKFGTPDLLDELLKKGANVNGEGHDDEAALINVAGGFGRCDDNKKLRYLLDAGADPNIRGRGILKDITTPLHVAVWTTSFLYIRKEDPFCSEMILSELIARGAHVSSLDSNGRTPLHIAAERNHLFAAQLLFKAGTKVMPRDNEGKTPLDLAESGEMVKLLKSHGATER